SASGGEAHLRLPLCTEAIRLARLLLRLWPSEPELMGLLALLLLQHSRHAARLDARGQIVLLEEQDRSCWHGPSIAEGRVLVEKALRHGRPGPYQVQAAIAAVHAAARRAGDTDWTEIERLYGVLERLEPTPVVRLNRAVAVWKSAGTETALQLLDGLGGELEGYFHFHGVRGSLLAEVAHPDALAELERALELARTPAEREHLQQKIEEISSDS
ncbi:MAG: hypothetical protein MI919_09935, partial [Holophagales bacterium]|nr:hypothetical protein [Holophagales bacterium]